MKSKYSVFAFVGIVILVMSLSLLLVYNVSVYELLSREDNVAEYLSALFLLLSSIIFLKGMFLLDFRKMNSNKYLMFLLAFLSFALFLAAGEEVSWGQRIFGIPTPEFLLEINDQDELNFHNISKHYFDKMLDRLTILFVIIGTVLLLLGKEKVLFVKTPDIYIICAFAITPFYKQDFSLNFFYIVYFPLAVLLVYSIYKKKKDYLVPVIITVLTIAFIQFIHTRFSDLFPLGNNSANEYKELMFCFCVLVYSYYIVNDIDLSRNKSPSIQTEQ